MAAPIAALYVQTEGCYYGLAGVDPWDRHRDARLYAGPHPVVAHPPCERWGRFYAGSPTVIARTGRRLAKGDDAGCFAAALAAVRTWGGVLEHPADSHAWRAFHLNAPPRTGGWVVADWQGGWTCCVEQGAYGHRARKATWLYAVAPVLPSLAWQRTPGEFLVLSDGFHTAAERAVAKARGWTKSVEHLPKPERAATPVPFRDLLLSIARSVRQVEAAA